MKTTQSRVPTALVAFGLLAGLCTVAAAAPGNEADRLRAEAGVLKQKAQDLIAQSQKLAEKAEAIEREHDAAGQVTEEPRAKAKQRIGEPERKSDPSSADERVRAKQHFADLQMKMKVLREAGRNEDADRLEQEARALRAELEGQRPGPTREFAPPPGRGPGPRPFAEAGERSQHLREAVGHLHAAGLHEVAEKLGREADRLEGELAPPAGPRPPQAAQPPAPQGPRRGSGQVFGPPGPGDFRVAELMDQVQQLRRAVEELRHRLDTMTERR